MRSSINDKRIRQLVIAVLLVILALGLVSLISSLFQLIVPLAIVAAGVIAFYKIVLQGRDKPAAMEDEIAESSGALEEVARESADGDIASESEMAAQERLSAVDQAKSEYLDKTTAAEEILDQIKARRQRLQGDDRPDRNDNP